MRGRTAWSRQFAFWRSVPTSSNLIFLAGVFVMFVPAGLLSDIAVLGASPPSRLVITALLSGSLAVAYVLVIRHRPRWLALLIVIHVVVVAQGDRIAGRTGAPLAGEALRARLTLDVNGSTTAIVLAFALLSQYIRREGTRYVRAHTEIALAHDIHSLLVPPIARRLAQFDFGGISLPSGEVGGDLIDLVESPAGWTSYVADVSGHGVAAGLLMGMVKSAARTQLRADWRLDVLLNTLNEVLFDLKGPTMFVTFAAVQYNGGAELQFAVAGHLPILQYRAATNSIEERSIPQLSIAMFPAREFVAGSVPYGPGDLFVILTDGLTEVFDRADREFGMDGIKRLIHEHARAPLETIEARLLAAVRAHGAQVDDQTLLLIRVLG
jgi:serine phosphatase RsbU (regulator of sigma subunit)